MMFRPAFLRFFIRTLFLALPLFSRAQNPVSIHVQIKGMGPGLCTLYSVYGPQNILADSVRLDFSGSATLNRAALYPGGLFYFVLPDNSWFPILLDKDQDFSLSTVKGYLQDSMKVSGSEDNELYFENLRWEPEFQKRLDPVNLRLNSPLLGEAEKEKARAEREKLVAEREAYLGKLQKEHPNSFFTTFKLAGQNPKLQYPRKLSGAIDTLRQTQLYKSDYWKNYDFSDDRLVRSPVLYNKLRSWIYDLTTQTPDSVIAGCDYVMKRIPEKSEAWKFTVNALAILYSAKHQANSMDPAKKPLMMGSERVYIHLMENYYTPEKAPWENPGKLYNLMGELRYMKNSQLGATGQDLEYTNAEGVVETLYGIKSRFRIVFIYSSSCDHCREQTPHMVELEKKYREQGLEVFAICIDPSPEKWKAFIEANGMQGFHNFHDPGFLGGNAKKYYVDVTPEAYLLDETHVIIAKDLKPEQIDTVITEQIKQGSSGDNEK